MTSGFLGPPCGRWRVRHTCLWGRANGDRSIAASLLTLNDHVHVQILRADVQANRCPGAEMIAGVDGTADMHACTDGPELLEVGVIACDGRRVDALLLPDLVSPSVACQTAVLGGAAVVCRTLLALECVKRSHFVPEGLWLPIA